MDGLSTREAEERLAAQGPNELPAAPPVPWWSRLLAQLRSPLLLLLLAATAVDLVFWAREGARGWPLEAIAILVVVLLNSGLGVLQELRSERALEALKDLALPRAWVMRDGDFRRLPARALVIGDLVRVSAGERIPADGRLLEAEGLLVDEAVLTGESIPVDRAAGDDLQSGTLAVRGRATMRVTATGPRSALGRLAGLIGDVDAQSTPLERRLDELGRTIARWVLALAGVLAVLGVAAEGPGRLEEVVLFAAALAVAAVPEGLPAVVTLALALGVQRMARRNAVVRRLAAVEALGSVDVIATDKTGTLTENRMTVRRLEASDRAEALLAMVLANDAAPDGSAGDPLDRGLLAFAEAEGVDARAARTARPRSSVRPFDSAWKFLRVTVATEAGPRSYLKGAPEVLLARCALAEAERAEWAARAERAAASGSRVLMLAGAPGEAEEGLAPLGLIHLWDPPRPEVRAAMDTARSAGIRVVMVTGDHPGTARAVAEAVGLPVRQVRVGHELEGLEEGELRRLAREVDVFARVTPEHKLRLVEALQAEGHVVAMTGDGVNDAPALKRADVGVSMGQRGSDVAREVSDLVLLDDDFSTIVGAVEEGRSIHDNIRKFVRFFFSTNVALVALVVGGAVGSWVLGLRDSKGDLLLPLTALQLLWINLIGDGPAALALALDQNPGVMKEPPRPARSPLLDGPALRFVLWSGLLKAAVGIAMLVALPLWGLAHVAVRSAVFLFEALSQLVFAYPSRDLGGAPARNRVLHLVILASVALQLLVVSLPATRRVLGLDELASGWVAGITLLALATGVVAEVVNRLSMTRRA